MSTYEVLEKALALIEDEKNWCQGGAFGPEGTLCAVAALERARIGAYTRKGPEIQALRALTPGGECVPTFNDTHTHAEVVALFQEAIRQEKAKEGIEVEIPEPVREEVAA